MKLREMGGMFLVCSQDSDSEQLDLLNSHLGSSCSSVSGSKGFPPASFSIGSLINGMVPAILALTILLLDGIHSSF